MLWRDQWNSCLTTRRPGFDSRRGAEFHFLSWDWTCARFVLSRVVSGGDPYIMITTDAKRSVLVFLSTVLVPTLVPRAGT